ncbi:hypothetical protein N7540_006075 [Penicillium herquei]|nr:hypothetical protein N7540_006075 [Penicillium herquei]
MTDPCLFHATLYIASAHADTLREASAGIRTNPNPATLYHHTKTIAAVNSRLAAGDIPSDATIGAVLMLLLSASIQGDSHPAEVHNMGLLRMVSMRGGLESLGFNGILACMIQTHSILPAVVFGQVDAFPGQWMKSPAALNNIPALTLARLEGYEIGGSNVRSYMATIFFQVWKLLLLVDSDGGEDDGKGHPFDFDSVRVLLDQEIPSDVLLSDASSTERAMVKSCGTSLRILQHLLDDRLPLGEETEALTKWVEELKSHLSMTDAPTWIKHAPHANLWVVMVGIAVSEDARERLWFLIFLKGKRSDYKRCSGRFLGTFATPINQAKRP